MKNACSETPAHDFRKGVSFNTIGLTAILGSLRSYILKLLEVQAAFLRPTMVSRACDSGAPLADPRSSIYQDWNIAETRMLTIGALARKTGSKVQTIRYYEQIGLMPEPGRTEGGQRRYGDAELDRLSFIRHARQLGFRLEAIRELLNLSDQPDKPCQEADSIARRQLKQVEQRLARLEALRTELERMVHECSGGLTAECRVLEVLRDHSECLTDHNEIGA